MDAIKEFLLKQVVVRMIYTAASFAVAHTVAWLALGPVQGVFAKAGVLVQVTDAHKLETFIAFWLMIAAETVLHFFHQNVVLPKVDEIQEQGVGK